MNYLFSELFIVWLQLKLLPVNTRFKSLIDFGSLKQNSENFAYCWPVLEQTCAFKLINLLFSTYSQHPSGVISYHAAAGDFALHSTKYPSTNWASANPPSSCGQPHIFLRTPTGSSGYNTVQPPTCVSASPTSDPAAATAPTSTCSSGPCPFHFCTNQSTASGEGYLCGESARSKN